MKITDNSKDLIIQILKPIVINNEIRIIDYCKIEPAGHSPSSETQGQLVGVGESVNGREKNLGLSSPEFFSRPFTLSPARTNCPWVSEDGHSQNTAFGHNVQKIQFNIHT